VLGVSNEPLFALSAGLHACFCSLGRWSNLDLLSAANFRLGLDTAHRDFVSREVDALLRSAQ